MNEKTEAAPQGAQDTQVEIHLSVAQKAELQACTAKMREAVTKVGSLQLQRRVLEQQIEATAQELQRDEAAFGEKMRALVSMGGGVVDAPITFDFNAGIVKVKRADAPAITAPGEKLN